MPLSSQIKTIGPYPSGSIDLIALAQIDPALGVQSLDVSVTGTINESVVIESSQSAPSRIDVTGHGYFSLDRPDGTVRASAPGATYFHVSLLG